MFGVLVLVFFASHPPKKNKRTVPSSPSFPAPQKFHFEKVVFSLSLLLILSLFSSLPSRFLLFSYTGPGPDLHYFPSIEEVTVTITFTITFTTHFACFFLSHFTLPYLYTRHVPVHYPLNTHIILHFASTTLIHPQPLSKNITPRPYALCASQPVQWTTKENNISPYHPLTQVMATTDYQEPTFHPHPSIC
ncbi:MAG: hypothetical protein BYD32DRAFT_254693 [Podila humilis]|nr:MAG: hypothetical protein BYD32DRAFT_254693 [Podila humilis]